SAKAGALKARPERTRAVESARNFMTFPICCIMEETLREQYGGAIRKGKSRTEIFRRKFGFAAACRGARSGSLRRADMDDRRLTELELKFMEQEQALSELSDMVNRQWQEIE